MREGGILLSPSILSADWTRLRDEIAVAEQGADWLHLDVMDGQFVPNLTFGPFIVKAIRRMTRLPLDVHLMILDPIDYVEAFREAGADWITVHVEARGVAGPGWPPPVLPSGEGARQSKSSSRQPRDPTRHAIDLVALREALGAIRASGAKVGLALRPDTPVSEVDSILAEIDLLLVMSVYPGFSGQPFHEEAVPKIREATTRRDALGARYLIEVDGGISADTIERVAEAGADVAVSGHGVYRVQDPLAAMHDLRAKAARARERAARSS